MMNDTILLVDYQNVRDSGLSDLPEHRRLLLFVGKGQKPKATFIEAAMKRGVRIDLVPVMEEGNNNLDFHLAFYLGRLLMEEPYGEFLIVSNDRDFEPLVRHMQSLGVSCERHGTLKQPPKAALPRSKPPAPSVPTKSTPSAQKAPERKTASKLDDYSQETISLLENETSDKRPDTRKKLLEYIVEVVKTNSSFAGQIAAKLEKTKVIKIDKGQVAYYLKKSP